MDIVEISNSDLRQEHIPKPFEKYTIEVQEFALTFNGYEYSGSFDGCAELADKSAEGYHAFRRLPEGLSELRACLFFEQRRWRYVQEDPTGEDLEYVKALVEAIREKIAGGQTDCE